MVPFAGAATPAILHVALNPVTGPWSVIRALAREQAGSGCYPGVGVGVITYKDWPRSTSRILAAFSPYAYRAGTPKVFGTAPFLIQRIVRPPIERWIGQMAARSGARSVVVHFHNAWLSGVLVQLGVAAVKSLRSRRFMGWPERSAGETAASSLRASVDGSAPTEVRDAVDVGRRRELETPRSFLVSTRALFEIIPNGLPVNSAFPRRGPVRPGELTVAHVGSLNAGKGWRDRRGRRSGALQGGPEHQTDHRRGWSGRGSREAPGGREPPLPDVSWLCARSFGQRSAKGRRRRADDRKRWPADGNRGGAFVRDTSDFHQSRRHTDRGRGQTIRQTRRSQRQRARGRSSRTPPQPTCTRTTQRWGGRDLRGERST